MSTIINGSGITTPQIDGGVFTSTGIDDNATSTAVTLASSGNVGIGTSSPTQDLHVVGNGKFGGAGGNYGIRIVTDADREGYLIFGDSADESMGGISYSNSTNALMFDANNAERMSIDSEGRVAMPYQPVISGQMGTAMTHPSSAQKLAFDQFWVNQGGITYNTTTRRFTVPVAGVYRVTLNPFFRSGVTAGRVLIGVNNNAPSVTTHYGHTYRDSATYDTGCLDSVVSLGAGDYIVFYLLSGGLYNQSSDRFNQFSIAKIA